MRVYVGRDLVLDTERDMVTLALSERDKRRLKGYTLDQDFLMFAPDQYSHAQRTEVLGHVKLRDTEGL